MSSSSRASSCRFLTASFVLVTKALITGTSRRAWTSFRSPITQKMANATSSDMMESGPRGHSFVAFLQLFTDSRMPPGAGPRPTAKQVELMAVCFPLERLDAPSLNERIGVRPQGSAEPVPAPTPAGPAFVL